MKLISETILCAMFTVCLATLSACKQSDSDSQQADINAELNSDRQGVPKNVTAGHGGKVIPLGTSVIGSFDVMVTRDVGEIVAGKDAPIDVTVTPVTGSTINAVAVRFWIGTENAVGSVKAKSEIENPQEPNRWHTHADVPNPIPADSKLWVEIEGDNGEKVLGSFDLNT
jgi:3D (Asp-Asp-Asp) domain-containing protein